MRPDRLTICLLLWTRLVRQLRHRGRGERESGAFLLAKVGSERVSHFICYDDLDPESLDSGIIIFRGSGFVPLWKYCQQEGMMVVADVHTHPSSWTGQSESDQSHPMVGQKGHVALIVPNYAQGNLFNLHGVGVYEYAGNHKWQARPLGKFTLTLP